jgi:hypothetical protein
VPRWKFKNLVLSLDLGKRGIDYYFKIHEQHERRNGNMDKGGVFSSHVEELLGGELRKLFIFCV